MMRMFEDYSVGTILPMGPHAVSQEAIIAFAAQYDPQPMHLDPHYPSEGPTRGFCASGWHVCGIMMRMMCDSFVNACASEGSPGVDRLAWRHPVRPGDVLSGGTEVLEARPSASRPAIGFLKLRTRLVNQDDVVVVEAEYSVMLRRRAEATS